MNMNVHSVTEIDEPPAAATKQRALIKEAVDAAAIPAMDNIKAWRREVDELETLIMQNSARVTDSLKTHVDICEAANIEINRLRGIVAEMRKGQTEP